MSDLLVITGLSGAGRSEFSSDLEDLGWFVIDRLPPDILTKVADLAVGPESPWDRVAFALKADTVEGDCLRALDDLREVSNRMRVVFLDCSTDELVRRYKGSRRPHPFPGASGIEAGIEEERALMQPVRAVADLVIDTSDINVHDLRDKVTELSGAEGDRPMRTSITSFGFKHGAPRDTDMLLDCRFIPNPHWVDELRPLSGTDTPVQDFVLGQDLTSSFLDQLEEMLCRLLPAYEAQGKAYLSIAFGCTGGRHRSVAVAEAMAGRLRERGFDPSIRHRDLDR